MMGAQQFSVRWVLAAAMCGMVLMGGSEGGVTGGSSAAAPLRLRGGFRRTMMAAMMAKDVPKPDPSMFKGEEKEEFGLVEQAVTLEEELVNLSGKGGEGQDPAKDEAWASEVAAKVALLPSEETRQTFMTGGNFTAAERETLLKLREEKKPVPVFAPPHFDRTHAVSAEDREAFRQQTLTGEHSLYNETLYEDFEDGIDMNPRTSPPGAVPSAVAEDLGKMGFTQARADDAAPAALEGKAASDDDDVPAGETEKQAVERLTASLKELVATLNETEKAELAASIRYTGAVLDDKYRGLYKYDYKRDVMVPKIVDEAENKSPPLTRSQGGSRSGILPKWGKPEEEHKTIEEKYEEAFEAAAAKAKRPVHKEQLKYRVPLVEGEDPVHDSEAYAVPLAAAASAESRVVTAAVNQWPFEKAKKGKNLRISDTLAFPIWLPIPYIPPLIRGNPFPLLHLPSIPGLFRQSTRVRLTGERHGGFYNDNARSPLHPRPSTFGFRRLDPMDSMSRDIYLALPAHLEASQARPHPACSALKKRAVGGGIAQTLGALGMDGDAVHYFEVRGQGRMVGAQVGVLVEGEYDPEERFFDHSATPLGEYASLVSDGSIDWNIREERLKDRGCSANQHRSFRRWDRIGVFLDTRAGILAFVKNGKVVAARTGFPVAGKKFHFFVGCASKGCVFTMTRRGVACKSLKNLNGEKLYSKGYSYTLS